MKILIIGGAGFIGINAAYYFIQKGYEISIVDNLSRPGSEYNLNQLRALHHITFYEEDIRNFEGISGIIQKELESEAILLLAGQVAVTTSVTNPREDFEINSLGTFNVLESMRLSKSKAILLYSSTNKVYGKMDDLAITELNNRYEYSDLKKGINENRLLDFYSPYGCSKGSADQYVHDYNRIFNVQTVVFRQSCIYGPNQFGIEDQGWVAWFTIATLLKKQMTIYGDGKQIRDILFVTDLVKLYELAIVKRKISNGKIYNVGGGVENTMSLNELVIRLKNRFNSTIDPIFDDWRPGDQKVYVSNIEKVVSELSWSPTTTINEGIDQMANWIEKNSEILNEYVFNKKK